MCANDQALTRVISAGGLEAVRVPIRFCFGATKLGVGREGRQGGGVGFRGTWRDSGEGDGELRAGVAGERVGRKDIIILLRNSKKVNIVYLKDNDKKLQKLDVQDKSKKDALHNYPKENKTFPNE